MSLPKSPRVSIITPVCNSARFLGATIESVCAQDLRDWELLCVIDPASNDRSEAIALDFAKRDRRVRVLKSESFGVAAARNLGLDSACGTYLAFLDSDDLWLPKKLSIQLEQTEAQCAVFSCTAFRRVNVTVSRIGRKIEVPTKITYARLLEQNCILASSVLLKREFAGAHRFADVGCEDFAMWLKLLKSGASCFGLAQDLVRYRIVPGSYGASKWRSLRATWSIYRTQEQLGLRRAFVILFMFILRGCEKYSRF